MSRRARDGIMKRVWGFGESSLIEDIIFKILSRHSFTADASQFKLLIVS
jgi:hypothetical protein